MLLENLPGINNLGMMMSIIYIGNTIFFWMKSPMNSSISNLEKFKFIIIVCTYQMFPIEWKRKTKIVHYEYKDKQEMILPMGIRSDFRGSQETIGKPRLIDWQVTCLFWRMKYIF